MSSSCVSEEKSSSSDSEFVQEKGKKPAKVVEQSKGKRKVKSAAIIKGNQSSDENDSEVEKPKKKIKHTIESLSKSSSSIKSTKENVKSVNGEEMIEFGKNRFVSCTEFKGKKMVNIREYYEKNGQWCPGKKGISMPLHQWIDFKAIIPEFEKLIQKNEGS